MITKRLDDSLAIRPRVDSLRDARPWSQARRCLAIFLCCAASTSTTRAQTLKTLFRFDDKHGVNPVTALAQGADGNLYGTTSRGGTNESGTVFQIKPAGQLTTLYEFCSQAQCSDGGGPEGGLLLAADGNFYGTTHGGGNATWGTGTVFKISSTGSLTTLHTFQEADGALPRGTLLQAADGSFYGTTSAGGSSTACGLLGCGTIYKIDPDGSFTTLYSFCSLPNCSDGELPVGGLIQGSDGNFYGTTYAGGLPPGSNGTSWGTVFKITPAGILTTLHKFCSQADCADGEWPNAALVQGKDGNFYGTTYQEGRGSVYALGTVFRITPAGQLTTLHRFCSQADCAEGGSLAAGLTLGKDGNFYGTTSSSGANGNGGTVFKINMAGTLTTLYSFCTTGVYPNCVDGQDPYGGLTLGSDGQFYGTTQGKVLKRCYVDCGTIFSFGTGLALSPAADPVGAKITIAGLNLTGATAVHFNGKQANFTLVSPTKITAIVPPGATTGTVKVTTPGGVLASNMPFVVTPRIVRFTPLQGPVGTAVTITGSTLTKASQVWFGGVPATKFTVNSDSQITAIVPNDAVSGVIAIAVPSGTAKSARIFTVTN